MLRTCDVRREIGPYQRVAQTPFDKLSGLGELRTVEELRFIWDIHITLPDEQALLSVKIPRGEGGGVRC